LVVLAEYLEPPLEGESSVSHLKQVKESRGASLAFRAAREHDCSEQRTCQLPVPQKRCRLSPKEQVPGLPEMLVLSCVVKWQGELWACMADESKVGGDAPVGPAEIRSVRCSISFGAAYEFGTHSD
jgi:hypothetical protein